MESKNPLISFLREEKILDEGTLQAVIDEHEKTGQGLINILKKEKLLDEDQLAKVIAGTNQTEFINLSPDMIEPMVAHLVPYELADQHNVIPVKREADHLYVAMSSPSNLTVRDQIEMKTGYKVIPVTATPSAIKRAINYHFDVANVTKQAIVSMRMEEESASDEQHDETRYESFRNDSSPIAKLVSSIVDGAIDARASDIHIEPQDSEVRVRYRIDGILRPTLNMPLSIQQEMVSHIKIMADMDISERRVPQDGHITTSRSGLDYDLRVSSLPAVGGEKIVIRILDKDITRWSIDEIVTNKEDNQKFRSLIDNPYGMLLLTGPTGSGKNTTLYSILQVLNTPEQNIVTVEDPVEYRMSGITQVQARPVAGRTFALALRSILRQDPDIILIGEIRDTETAEIAVSAALTGHLVLSTLHTNDAAGAISRLIDLGTPPFLVASALLGTAAQRLIRTSCLKCRQSYRPSKQELERLFGDKSRADADIELYRSSGCESCHHTGYHGRKSIYEILHVSPEIRKLIMEERSDQDIKQQAVKEGMKILRDKAVDEVLAGVTTIEEMMRIVDVKVV
ncbi:MAG: type II/IV secretion system protein [Sedimentisphaerales bacterium]|nr:type II/IV secretion system protein [Sedimentisphaerales bacterium]